MVREHRDEYGSEWEIVSSIQIHRAHEALRRRASLGSVGDSYGNALAETINGPYKAEVIWRRAFWRSLEQVEVATLEWVDWFTTRGSGADTTRKTGPRSLATKSTSL
jgi:transposase InsO family protein